MKYEFNDHSLAGKFVLSKGFGVKRNRIPITQYTFIWNQGSEKEWLVDFIPTRIPPQTIFSLSPGQVLTVDRSGEDYCVIQFNREFYCVETHDVEVSCNGMLFNGVLTTPILVLDPEDQRSFGVLLEVMREEFHYKDDVQPEMLKTVLKRFIIKCTRLAKTQFKDHFSSTLELDTVRLFSALVEKHFRGHHKVADYANLMNKSPKTLANVFKSLSPKTPLEIIHERIVLEARKMLLFTDKPSKEIGFDLGFSDPVQFSRLFKNKTGLSPGEFKKNGILSQPGNIVR
ncbi:MAG: helix-turn-helix domain-containing protein [Cyclobacteriaceae bacterium]